MCSVNTVHIPEKRAEGLRPEPVLHTKVQENHWVCPKRLLLLCIMSKLLLQVILKDPV